MSCSTTSGPYQPARRVEERHRSGQTPGGRTSFVHRASTLIISARDDRYGTYASAQYTASPIAGAKFVGFDEGGYTWVGHNDEVMAEIVKLLAPPVGR